MTATDQTWCMITHHHDLMEHPEGAFMLYSEHEQVLDELRAEIIRLELRIENILKLST